MSKVPILLTATWAVLHSMLYGFHISALNGVQASVTCQPGQQGSKWGLSDCVELNPSQFGVVVSIFTLGGLLGSLSADAVTRRLGRPGTLRLAEICFLLGTAGVGLANAMWLMVIGRILVGMASGLTMVTVPLFLGEVAPERWKTSFGVLHQVAIGIGMLVAQSLSLVFAKPWLWRAEMGVAFGIGAALLIGSAAARGRKRDEEEEDADDDDGEQRPLLSDRDEEGEEEDLAVTDLLRADADVKRGVLVVVIAQMAQQICGISPVMYFSTQIFTPLFQARSKLVALGIMAIGIPFNFVPGLLPDSIGAKRFLLISSFGTSVTCFLLAMGLNMHAQALSATAIVFFVLSFSIGLAPMPWVILSQVVPPRARTAGGAVAVSANWLTNFAAGSLFLPLQEALRRGPDQGAGNVFFVFCATSAVAFLGIWSSYKLYERGHQA